MKKNFFQESHEWYLNETFLFKDEEHHTCFFMKEHIFSKDLRTSDLLKRIFCPKIKEPKTCFLEKIFGPRTSE